MKLSLVAVLICVGSSCNLFSQSPNPAANTPSNDASMDDASMNLADDGEPDMQVTDARTNEPDVSLPDAAIDIGTDTGFNFPIPPTCLERSTEIRMRPPTIVVGPATNGQVLVNGMPTTLRQVIVGAVPGDVIALEDGTYALPEAAEGGFSSLHFIAENVTLRSVSGNRDAVILDSAYANHGGQTTPITVSAPNVTLADFTIKRSIFSLIDLTDRADDVEIHNLVLEDGGRRFIEARVNSSTSISNGEIACSSFLMTDAGRDNIWGEGAQDGYGTCQTGGIALFDSRNWRVADNYFEGLYCTLEGVQRPAHGKKSEDRDNETYVGGLGHHTVHIYDSPEGSGHRVERNKIVNCARGIGAGLVSDVYGIEILNNMIFSEFSGAGNHDVGIGVDRGKDVSVLNNSIYFSSSQSYPNAIEFRWEGTSDLEIRNNVTNRRIFARDEAQADLSNNRVDAPSGWFVDADSGELHINDCDDSAELVGAGIPHELITTDFDRDLRVGRNDIGADQCP